MFRALSSHLQEDTVVYMQHKVSLNVWNNLLYINYQLNTLIII